MPINQFLPFATAGGAPVLNNAAYAGITPAIGFPAGILAKESLNKVLRQSSVMSSMIGSFILGRNLDALDDGNLAVLLANFKTALRTQALTDPAWPMTAAANGSITFPGGVILKWGTTPFYPLDTADNVYTFPTAFPTNCWVVVATSSTNNSVGDPGERYSVGIHTKSAASFLVNNDTTGATFDFFAVGN